VLSFFARKFKAYFKS